jgi:MFS transporter, DHA1 family, multidrug resistance protein
MWLSSMDRTTHCMRRIGLRRKSTSISVHFDDKVQPMLMSDFRVLTAIMLGYTTSVSAFTSSIFSTATRTVAEQYHVSTEVGLLGLSFYVLGFAFGPIFWAPLSELRGRRLPLVVSMFGFSIFQIAVAAAKDLQTILLCRFWGGVYFLCFCEI